MGGMEKKYNLKSPAVKRLMREAVELKDPTFQYHAQPLEDNLFEWHFTVRGPPDTEFAGGRYHGRITLPAEYPMKPPSIILLTPNGRFDLGKKICLSMSAHHPETWQPSWSLRTVMLALIGFMPTKGAGAIGALDYAPEERKILAARSNDWTCGACGFDHRTCLLDVADSENSGSQDHEAKELAAQINFKAEEKPKSNDNSTTHTPETETSPLPNETLHNEAGTSVAQQHNADGANPEMVVRQRTAVASPNEQQSNDCQNNSSDRTTTTNVNDNNENSMADYVSLVLLWVVAIVLVVLILRRLASENNTLSKV